MLVLLLINFVRIIATIERQTRHWRWKLASIWWGVPRCTRPPHKSTCDHDGDLQSYRHGSPWKSSHRNYPCMYVWFGSVLQRKIEYCKQMVKLQNWIHEKQANECVLGDGLKRHTHLFQWTAPFWHNSHYNPLYWAYLSCKLCSWKDRGIEDRPKSCIQNILSTCPLKIRT